MMVPESDMISPEEEKLIIESTLEQELQPKSSSSSLLTSVGRQSSIYSLTLDEFQHTLCESGKNFGSMNMDEFLTSIWTAEENQVAAAAAAPVHGSGDNDVSSKQPSLSRQGSLTLPAPLCRKTVDEVWSEIHSSSGDWSGSNGAGNSAKTDRPAPRQPTFGEMTLEDFLIKAGVVREQQATPPPPQHPSMYGSTSSNSIPSSTMGTGFLSRPVVGAASGYQPPALPSYGGRVGNDGAAEYGASQVSSEGMIAGIDNAAVGQFGMDVVGLRGRKRVIDGPVEKVVERRQRRMIKNRESAARSRARKQAYTVELEAELNQLKEENRQLKQAVAELERKRKQQFFEEMRTKVPSKAQKTKEKLRMMKRNMSCAL